MNLVYLEDKLADIEIAIREFGVALKQCINDFRTAYRIGVITQFILNTKINVLTSQRININHF